MSLGIGLSINNTAAVLGALRGRSCEFVRTPKYDLRGRRGTRRGKRYAASQAHALIVIEWLFAIYLGGGVVAAIGAGHYSALPFLLLFLSGFVFVAMQSVRQQGGGASASSTPRSTVSGEPISYRKREEAAGADRG